MAICARKFPKKNVKIAGIIVFHKPTKEVLMLQRKNGNWDLPKGHVEENEPFFEAAVRECWEETGLSPKNGLDIYPYTYISLASKSWVRFYLGYTNSRKIKLSPEHISYRWATPQEAIKYFKRNTHFSQIVRAMYTLSYC
jgi:8-oxo-dGTP diphosphatase